MQLSTGRTHSYVNYVINNYLHNCHYLIFQNKLYNNTHAMTLISSTNKSNNHGKIMNPESYVR